MARKSGSSGQSWQRGSARSGWGVELSEHLKRRAAEAAIAELSPGMRIGLGTGSTARQFVELLGEKVAGGFACTGVPTSATTARQARDAGISLTTLDDDPHLDIAVDGTDEIDPSLNLIKGGGGALLREKIVAAAADRFVVIGDGSKQVDRLGRFALPVEFDAFGLGHVRGAVAAIMRDDGAAGEVLLRRTATGEPFVTDGGHLIFDAFFGRISDTKAVAHALNAVPGIVEHGLFVGMCEVAYIGTESGVTVMRAGRATTGPAS